MTTDVERLWLAYAGPVVGDAEHRVECRLAGGSPDHPGVDATDLRWPGYLGDKASVGTCVLVVSNIHRDFASASVGTVLRDRLVTTTRGWRDGQITDDDYLAAVRAVYLAGLGRWRVGVHIRYVMNALNGSLRDLAYANAARCQYPEISPALPGASTTKRRLQRLCLARFPIVELTRILRPRLVTYTSTSAYDAALSSGKSDVAAPTACMHQLNGTLARPLTVDSHAMPIGTPREHWVSVIDHVDAPAVD